MSDIKYYIFWRKYLERDDFIKLSEEKIDNHNRIYKGSNVESKVTSKDILDKFEEVEDLFLGIGETIHYNFVANRFPYFGVLIEKDSGNYEDFEIIKKRALLYKGKMSSVKIGWNKLSITFYL
jgi:hypothetical protein